MWCISCSWGAEVLLRIIFVLGGHNENMLKFAGESPRDVCKEDGELFEEVPNAGYSVLKGKDPNS